MHHAPPTNTHLGIYVTAQMATLAQFATMAVLAQLATFNTMNLLQPALDPKTLGSRVNILLLGYRSIIVNEDIPTSFK